jgi:hypothetical protein
VGFQQESQVSFAKRSVCDRQLFASESVQVGPLISAPEKTARSTSSSAKAVRSPQSDLSSRNCEKWPYFAAFQGDKDGNSLRFRLGGGEGVIRTLDTGVSPYNGLAIRF